MIDESRGRRGKKKSLYFLHSGGDDEERKFV